MKARIKRLRDTYTGLRTPCAGDVVALCDDAEDLTARLEAIHALVVFSGLYHSDELLRHIRQHLPDPPKPKRTGGEARRD